MKVIRRCKTCNSVLCIRNKSGFCNKHRDRTGKNNSFFGKHHTEEHKQKSRETSRISTKKLWKNEEYRKKIIKGTSKPRKESFKREQSERITKWYKDNPEQREIRSISMKMSWKFGRIKPNINKYNRSKMQIELYELLLEKFDDISDKQIIYGENRRFMPDIISPKDGLIIEFYGDYWHANPNKYHNDDIIHHGITAQQIWDTDNSRTKELEKLGYSVHVIWQNEFIKNPNNVIDKFATLLNWEGCAI